MATPSPVRRLGASARRDEQLRLMTKILEMTEEALADLYPDGPKALPPELGRGTAA